MTALFARLYFDEDVSVRVADMLKACGFDVLTTLQAERLGNSRSRGAGRWSPITAATSNGWRASTFRWACTTPASSLLRGAHLASLRRACWEL